MGLFSKNKTPVMTRGEALSCIPVTLTDVTVEQRADGGIFLVYPVRMRPWMEGWVRRLGGTTSRIPPKKIQLDEMGTAVWELLDGNRTVKDIIRIFAESYQLHLREAEVSVSLFLRELGRRGLILLR
jgi:hypothetical protein